MTYTKEQWVAVSHQTENKALIQSTDGRHLAELWTLDKEINCKANADRIVACVNAMEGIESPAKLRETWNCVRLLELDAYPAMEAQRNKLLEALMFCRNVIETQGIFDLSERIAWEKATEAINAINGSNED